MSVAVGGSTLGDLLSTCKVDSNLLDVLSMPLRLKSGSIDLNWGSFPLQPYRDLSMIGDASLWT